MSDFRLAFRSLLRNRVFSAMAILTLALGVGLTTVVFSVLDTVILRPLPFANAERLVLVWHRDLSRDGGLINLSYLTFSDLATQNQSFEHLAALGFAEVTVEGDSGPERLPGLRMTSDLLRRLGAVPMHGRLFLPEDDEPGAAAAVVIGYELWQTRFGGSANLPGGTVVLDGEPHIVVGIMPPGFQFPPTLNRADTSLTAPRPVLWMPLTARDAPPRREQRVLLSLGTLRAGVTLAEAQAEVDVVARRLAEAFPDANADLGFTLVPLHEQVTGRVRPAIIVLFGAVSVLVAIVCVNIGNLLLTRAVGRRKEVAIRLALGGNRARIVRHLLAECLWISGAAAVVGLLVASWGLDLLALLAADQLPLLDEVGLHPEVFAFAIGLSLLCGAMVSLTPLAHATAVDLVPALQADGPSVTTGRRGQFTRRVLSASQVALAVVLLTGGGLMVQTLLRLTTVDPGFNPERLLTMQLFVAPTVARQVPERVAIHERIVNALAALPGVSAAGSVSDPPLSTRADAAVTLTVEGMVRSANEEGPQATYRPAGADYFRAMDIPLRHGRLFAPRDGIDSPGVIIVNEALAQRLWPGQDPLGRRLQQRNEGEWLTVIGVVGDVRQDGPGSAPAPEIYRPYAQEPGRSFTVVLRTTGVPVSVAAVARAAIREVAPAVPVSNVQAMVGVVAASMWMPRLTTAVLGLFASLALLLAMLGIYGTVSHSVAQRTREFGLRIALGADRRDLRRLILRQELPPLVVGLAIGLAAARLLAQVMADIVFGVSPTDPATIAAAAAFLLAAAVLACTIPARRAAAVDPLTALRSR